MRRSKKSRTAAAAGRGAPEVQFEQELEVFRTEVETALQFFYGFLAIHACAGDTPTVHRLLNTAPLFWNSTLGALQTSTFVVLGRIFDQSSPHNIGVILALAEGNSSIFSKTDYGDSALNWMWTTENDDTREAGQRIGCHEGTLGHRPIALSP